MGNPDAGTRSGGGMAYTTVLEAVAARRAGSSPVPSTINELTLNRVVQAPGEKWAARPMLATTPAGPETLLCYD